VRIAPPQPTELVITGRILNKTTNTLVSGGKVRYGSNNITDNLITTEDGYYTLRIPKGIEFQLIPEKGGFSGKMEKALFRRDYYYFQESYTIDLYLEPLQEGSKIELRPIFFQQSKAIILEPSYAELQRLADILIENPGMAIRVEGHTDNIGQMEDLLQLSQDRAQAVKDFLVDRGVSADRIETAGYGAQFPLTENNSDEERSQNRRVEVRITKI
jgi:outer membrane protein OmpA-like peptidoglycan-associated protein